MNIFKRKKPLMPEPKFDDNWMQDRYEQNVKQGIESLRSGKTIHIMDDGRGYELALDIKRGFILEYQKQLSEKIEIKNGKEIIIKFNNK
jgi:hypothetical protein